MRRLVPLVLATACSFEPTGTRDGAPPGELDARAAVDAAVDAAPQVCRVAATTPTATGTTLGSTGGGSARDPLGCPPGELPIGAAFDLTDNRITNHGNQRLVSGIHLRCGAIDLVDGVALVAPTGEVVLRGDTGGNCSNYLAFTTSAEAACPTGTVLVGLDGNRPDDVLFNNVSLRCAPLSAAAVVGTDVTLVAVTGTGTDANQPQTAACPAGTAVVELRPNSGCGIDGVTLQCAPLACP
ncbi:MAG: hypothetical protein IPL61_23515 [Myxococcales bacterium]|nr:hypothetical protein [Myxococcales bacterium]